MAGILSENTSANNALFEFYVVACRAGNFVFNGPLIRDLPGSASGIAYGMLLNRFGRMWK